MIEVEIAVVVIEVDDVIAVESSTVLVSVVVLAAFSLSVVVLVDVRDLYTRKLKMEIKSLYCSLTKVWRGYIAILILRLTFAPF